MTKLSKSASRVIWALWIALCAAVLAITTKDVINGFCAYGWPISNGIITSAQITEVHDTDIKDKATIIYQARISYTYAVNGSNHNGDVVRFGQSDGSHEEAAQIVNRYPRGRQVAVRYRPDNPSLATLEPGVSNEFCILIFGLSVMVIFGIIGFIRGWQWSSVRRRHRQY